MKIKFCTIYVALISTSLLAQQDTNTPTPPATNPPPAMAPIETPAPAPAVTTMPEVKPDAVKTPPPAAHPAKKKVAKKKAAPMPELKTVPLVPGPAVVVAKHVNVRGRAGLVGEVITRMTNGEPVTVIEEIRLKKSAPDEPSAWAKIALPGKLPVWINSSYIDKTTQLVKPKTLNLRGGPGENYSVLGSLKRGDAVKEIETKGPWMKIEAPTNAYAFMAAQYLSQESAAIAAAGATSMETNPPVEPPTMVVENPPVVSTNTEVASNMATNVTEAPSTSIPTNEVASTESTEPPPPRIVSHEGFVRPSISIQAPTSYELISLETHKIINYLYTTSTNLDLSRYKGLQIIVTGEEGLDERWRNSPVITIRRIQVIE